MREDHTRLIEALVQGHRSSLLAYTVRFTGGDRAWAEDIVQETFLRAWHHIDRMTAAHGSVRAWLMRVAHNLAVDSRRGRRACPSGIDFSQLPGHTAADSADDVASSLVVEQALATLSHSHRAVLEQTVLRDSTAADAARRAALNRPSASTRCRRLPDNL